MPLVPKSVRIQSSCKYLFTLLGSTGAKAAHRTLMKLTPACVNFINIPLAAFSPKIPKAQKDSKVVSLFCSRKSCSENVMKLTPRLLGLLGPIADSCSCEASFVKVSLIDAFLYYFDRARRPKV
jgi:hypothetical protein